jgi:protein-tyrosine phosphatase
VEEYIKELNDVELAKVRLKKVIEATRNKPLYEKYEKGAALKLAEFYVKEGDYEMGRRYLSYVLEHSIDEYLSDNVNITKVIDNLKNKWPTYYPEPQRCDFLDFTRALQ